MSFIDPESPRGYGHTKDWPRGCSVAASAELADKHPTIKARILSLCQVSLDRAKRNLLASVIVQLGDKEFLVQAPLFLLDDD